MNEMSKDAFWALIAEAKKECGSAMDGEVQWLEDRLTALGPQQAQDFHNFMHGYEELADQYGLWSAASILCGGCSDDGFIDFRAWLIAQGKEVYLAALRDPDTLAEVKPYGGCQFERLTYVGACALGAMTGENAYDRMALPEYRKLVDELRKDITYGKGIGYPYEWGEVELVFPRLCAKYLSHDDIQFHLKFHETMWAADHPEIQKVREGGTPPKEEAVASINPALKILNAFPHLARCAEKADPEIRAEAAEAIAKVVGGDAELMSRFQAAMAYCDCIDLPEAVAVAEHLDCFEFIPIAEFKAKAKDELLGLGLDERVIDQCIDFSQYAAIKHGWGDLFCAQDAGQYIRQSDQSFILSEYVHPKTDMTMGGMS